MGGWKDELKKIRPTFGSRQDAVPNNRPTKNESATIVQEKIAWKNGVKPLGRGSDRVTPRDSRREKAIAQERSSGQDRHARVGKKQSRNIPQRKFSRVPDGLPSMATIVKTYGTPKKKSKPTLPLVEEAETLIPGLDDLPQVSLTRDTEFKVPDAWVNDGAVLQAPGGGGSQILRVRIGIDFGTAYTKVALRVADKVFFVDWSGVRVSSEKFLLPGEISRCDDGSIWLGRHPKASEMIGGLKSPYLSRNQGKLSDKCASVAFLAWVIRYTRAWLYRHQLPLVQARCLVWEINIGSPTDPWTLTEVRKRYEQLVLSAWQLSQVQGNCTMQAAEALLNGWNGEGTAAGLDDFHVLPEFVAQVAGYVKSPQRQDGLHLLVDVGAGTMDITAFNVYRPSVYEEDRFPIFEGAVEPLGAHVLMAARFIQSGSAGRSWADQEGVPSLDQLSQELGIEKQALMDIDDRFTRQVSMKVGGILQRTKKYRDPMADAWKEGMRVFLAGGGSVCDVYKNGVRRSFEGLRAEPRFTPFPMLDEGGKCIGTQDFHRVSVAFGLTYGSASIGKIIRPQEIKDISLDNQTRWQPDRDELYPK